MNNDLPNEHPTLFLSPATIGILSTIADLALKATGIAAYNHVAELTSLVHAATNRHAEQIANLPPAEPVELPPSEAAALN